MFCIVFEVKELFISLQPDVRLRWGLDQTKVFWMDKWFILKNRNWILPTCDSFPLIVSQLELTVGLCPLWNVLKLHRIADVAVTKYHQRLDKLLIFVPHCTENQQSCLRENSNRNARIYNKPMLYEMHTFLARLLQAYVVRTWLRQVSQAYCMTQFSWK